MGEISLKTALQPFQVICLCDRFQIKYRFRVLFLCTFSDDYRAIRQTIADQWRSQPDNLVPLCTIYYHLHFFRN